MPDPVYFGVTTDGRLLPLGTHADADTAEAAALSRGEMLVFLVDQPTAGLLRRRLALFMALEPLPGLQWFAHFEWDGKLYLLEEFGDRQEAEAVLAACGEPPVALLSQQAMREWHRILAE